MNFRLSMWTALLVLGVSLSAAAGDWPHWRGPHYHGMSTETSLPATANEVWAAPMPGTSSSTPIISGDAVFVVSNDAAQEKVVGMCLDRKTGSVRWQKVLGEAAVVKTRNDMASCSPVTDGKTVYFLHGGGTLYAYDFDGKEQWQHDLAQHTGTISMQFGYASTPLLHEGRLYIPVLRGQWEAGNMASFTDKDSYLYCLDAATGQEIWRQHRPSDARGESFDSYASAVPFESAGVPALLVQGGDYLSAHQLSDGAELWRHAHNAGKHSNWRLIPSPVAAQGLAIGIEPRGGDMFAVMPGEKKELAYEEAHWILPGPTSDVPTPAVYEGKMYVIKGTRGDLLCIDVKTGKLLWEADLDTSARVWGSPTVGDGKLYCLDEKGQLTIAALEATGVKILEKVEYNSSHCKSTVAVSNGQLFVRTSEKLYCLGQGTS